MERINELGCRSLVFLLFVFSNEAKPIHYSYLCNEYNSVLKNDFGLGRHSHQNQEDI